MSKVWIMTKYKDDSFLKVFDNEDVAREYKANQDEFSMYSIREVEPVKTARELYISDKIIKDEKDDDLDGYMSGGNCVDCEAFEGTIYLGGKKIIPYNGRELYYNGEYVQSMENAYGWRYEFEHYDWWVKNKETGKFHLIKERGIKDET